MVARNTEHIYNYQVDANFLKIAQTITIAPEPLRKIIDAVGILKYNEQVYIPAVAANVFNRNGNFVPRPESVLLTNLHQIVVTLADPETPAAYRQRFADNNPIPGAVFDENNVLLNPNEIIPDNYNVNVDLRNDITTLGPMMVQLKVCAQISSGSNKF